MALLTVLVMRPDLATCTAGALTVSSVAAQLNVERVNELQTLFSPHRDAWGDGELNLTLLKPSIPLPDDAARARINEINAAGRGASLSVVVMDADGFWAATTRAIIASFALVSKRAPKVTRTVAEALEILRPRLGDLDVPALTAEIVAFRDAHLAMGASSKPSR